MSETMPNMANLVRNLKSTYLDSRGVGIRRFAEMTHISRTRLKKFFSGEAVPTEQEIYNISVSMDIIESQYEKSKELEQKKEFKTEINKLLKTTKP